VRVAFLLNDLMLAGGVGVVIEHARQLSTRHGHDVVLVLRDEEGERWNYQALEGLSVQSLATARTERFDVVFATWWETAYFLFDLQAHRHAYFVQSLEDRFYPLQDAKRFGAAFTHDLPVSVVTEARWIADLLDELRPGTPCYYVRNGIDKSVFPPVEQVEPNLEQPLRILIEGRPDVWFKGVSDALEATRLMCEPRFVTAVVYEPGAADRRADRVVGPLPQRQLAELYAETDVVLKLSRVEGMFGPPLEGFHRGATCVVTPVTGHAEYVVHGWNGLVADWDDLAGTARLLDLLARDRRLLHFLRTNALATAKAWPSWQQSSDMFALALERIVRSPAPAPSAILLKDARAFLYAHQLAVDERRELEDTAATTSLARSVLALVRRRARRSARLRRLALSRPLAPITHRLHERVLRSS
jgi:O-antigen biosynthesis protein